MRRIVATLAATIVLGGPGFAHPNSGIAVDPRGEVYFVDTGSGLWKIDTKGALVQIPAPRFHWMALDPDNRLGSTRLPTDSGGEITRVGTQPAVLLSSDAPLAVGSDGALYYPTRASAGALDVVRLPASGRRAVLASIRAPYLSELAAAPDGSLYFSESAAVRRIDAQGRVTTLAANVALTGCASIPGTDGEGPMLRGLAVTTDGTVYAAATGCGRVLKIAPGGKITTVLQLEAPWSPTSVALSGKDLYVLEYLHTPGDDRRQWVPRVRKITPDGKSALVATVKRD